MEKLLTVDDVAELLRFPKQTIYQMVCHRKLPVVRLSGRCLRFRLTDIEAFLDGKLIPAGAPIDETRAVIHTGKPGRPKYVSQDIDSIICKAKKEILGS